MIRLDVFNLYASIALNLDDFNTNLDRAQKKFSSFANSISSLSKKIDSAYKGVGDVLKPAVDGFKSVESVGQKALNGLTTAAKGFAAITTAVGGFGVAAAKSGAEFDATMSEVSAISGATGDEFDSLRDKALEMGARTKFSASEAASAMTYMGMAGWKAGDMISGIEGIMNLAAASGEDLATTSDIVTDALTAFGLKAADSGHFADILAAASSNANTNVSMMGDTFKYVAPIAGAMGYSAEDTAVAIGLMANSGIKATQAGTALRSIITRMAKPTKESAAAMSALGVSVTNSDGSMKSLAEVIVDLREGFSGMTESERASYAAMLGGQEAMSGLLAIVNSSDTDFKKLTNSIDGCTGAAEKMAAVRMDNLQGDVTLLKSGFESLQIAISDGLTPTLREFAKFGQRAVGGLLDGFQGSGVSGFMDALSGFITEGVTMLSQKAADFAGVALQFVQAIGTGLIDAAPKILTAASGVVDVLVNGIFDAAVNHGNKITEVGKNIIEFVCSGFSKAAEAIGYAIDEFMPLLVDGFLSYHEALFNTGIEIIRWIGKGISDDKKEIQETISETITNMVTALTDNAPMIIAGGLALLEALVGAIEENLPYILEAGATIVGKLVEGIATASPGVQAIIGTAVLPHILKIIDVVTGIGGAVSAVANVASKAITGIIGIGGKLMGGVKALFALLAANPIALVVAAIAGLVAAFVGLWNTSEEFRNFWIGLWENLKNVVSTAVDAIVGFFSGIVDFIKNNWQSLLLMIVNPFAGAFKLIYDNCEEFRNFVDGLMEAVGEIFSAGWEAVKGFFLGAWDAIKGAWDAAVGFFEGIWDGISGAFSAVADWFGDKFSAAWDAVSGVWDGATEFFSGIWDDITGVFSGAFDTFKDIGGNIVKGIWDGITGLANWLREKVTGFFSGIVDGVKGMLGIHSPSTVFAGIGGNMALGLGSGWDSEYNDIKRQIEGSLNFGTASVSLNATARYGAQEARQGSYGGMGNTYVTINSPVAVDGVQAAREWQKTAQRMALGYV